MANGGCQVCQSPEREEIEAAYRKWYTTAAIARTYDVRPAHLTAHAEAFEWNKQRAENMDLIYDRLLNDIMETFDPAQLKPADAIFALATIAKHRDRVQGKIIDKHEINQNKSVTFIAIPLPGGSKPILPEAKRQILLKGNVVEAEFENEREGPRADGVSEKTSEGAGAPGGEAEATPKARY